MSVVAGSALLGGESCYETHVEEGHAYDNESGNGNDVIPAEARNIREHSFLLFGFASEAPSEKRYKWGRPEAFLMITDVTIGSDCDGQCDDRPASNIFLGVCRLGFHFLSADRYG